MPAKITTRTSFALMVLLISVAFSILPTTGRACDNGIAVISGGTNYPPLTWREGDKLVGATVKLVQKLFAEVGIEARADEGGPWKRVLLRAQRGKVDMLLGIRKSSSAEKHFTFIEPAITPSVQSVFVAKERNWDYEQWQDLKGKAGGTTLGASFGQEFDQFAQAHLYIEQARTIKQNFEKLHKGRVDYVLGPLMTLRLHAIKEGYKDTIIDKPVPLIIIDEYLAIPHQSACSKYLAHFSKRIKEVQADESWDQMLEEYFAYWFEKNLSKAP